MSVFVDWVTATTDQYNGKEIDSGFIRSVASDGSIEWEKSRHASVTGSYSSTVLVRAWRGHFSISGNPTKFLQGHNVFGSWDIRRVICLWIGKIYAELSLECLALYKAVLDGNFKLSRLDITGMFDVGISNSDVAQWLYSAGPSLAVSRQPVTFDQSSIYIGKRSNYITVVCYNKFEEMKRHKLQSLNVSQKHLLNEWARNKLRIEIRFKRSFLATNCILEGKPYKMDRREQARSKVYKHKAVLSLSYLSHWTPQVCYNLYSYYLEHKVMQNLPPESVYTENDLVFELSPAVHSTYKLWKLGEDVKAILPKSTYYRHKKIIMEEVGLNISSNSMASKLREKESTVIPLLRTLEAAPANIPDWAEEYELLA